MEEVRWKKNLEKEVGKLEKEVEKRSWKKKLKKGVGIRS